MRRLIGGAAVLAAAMATTTASGQVYYGTGVPAAVSDMTLTTVDIPVAGGPASITQVNVLLNITHTYEGDLDIIIKAPDNRYVHLTSDNGAGNNNMYNTRFTTCGSASITTATIEPMTGNWLPEGGDAVAGGWAGPALPGPSVASLAGFNGMNSNGTWQLWVYDDAGIDVGSVDSVALEFNGSLDAAGPPAPSGSNPSGIAAANPGSAQPGTGALFTVTVAPGGCPSSTGLAVTMDLSGIGGSATQQLFDNGSNGDVTAGDSVFSFQYTIPAAQGGGAANLAFTVSDTQQRTGGGTLAFYVSAAPGVFTDLGAIGCGESTYNLDIGAAQELKWYRFSLAAIADPGYFDIWTTLNSTISLQDSELALFDSNGGLVATDDDDGGGSNGYLSELSFGAANPVRATGGTGWVGGNGRDGAALGAGTYWLCVGGFNMIPTAGAGAGWRVTSTSTYTGSVEFKINAQHNSCVAACVADVDDGSATGVHDGAVTIDDLIFFLTSYEAGTLAADVDNGTFTGTTDQAVTVDDLLYFLFRYEAGCEAGVPGTGTNKDLQASGADTRRTLFSRAVSNVGIGWLDQDRLEAREGAFYALDDSWLWRCGGPGNHVDGPWPGVFEFGRRANC